MHSKASLLCVLSIKTGLFCIKKWKLYLCRQLIHHPRLSSYKILYLTKYNLFSFTCTVNSETFAKILHPTDDRHTKKIQRFPVQFSCLKVNAIQFFVYWSNWTATQSLSCFFVCSLRPLDLWLDSCTLFIVSGDPSTIQPFKLIKQNKKY